MISGDRRSDASASQSRCAAPKRGVHFAAHNGEGVLLDIAANRYIHLSPISSELWQGLLLGEDSEALERRVKTADPARRAAVVARQLEQWEVANLLESTASCTDRIPKPLERLAPPTRAFARDHGSVSMRAIVHMAACSRWAWTGLRRRGLRRTLIDLEEARRLPLSGLDVPTLVRAYTIVRMPFAQGRERQDCLERSLALARTLREHGHDARLCIGIHNNPFMAHAWTQLGDVVLNDTLERTAMYAIIACF